LLEYEKEVSDLQVVKAWVNERNGDQFTALHFAAYRGSIRMLELLIMEGADLHVSNA